MSKKSLWFLLFCLCALISCSVHAIHQGEKLIAGWVESIVLEEGQFSLTAKLDTGARTSSIHAKDIGYFERDSKRWVRFTLLAEEGEGTKAHEIEAELLRTVKIKRHKLPSMQRPVVSLGFCMNGHYYKTQFTLADRSNYLYPMLLGRRFLKGRLLVDPEVQFTRPKQLMMGVCRPEPKK